MEESAMSPGKLVQCKTALMKNISFLKPTFWLLPKAERYDALFLPCQLITAVPGQKHFASAGGYQATPNSFPCFLPQCTVLHLGSLTLRPE